MEPPHNPFNLHFGQSSSQSSSKPEPTNSPPQSVPGRRTPLGAVGLGGFYTQGGHSASSMHLHTDENRLAGTSRYFYNLNSKFVY